MPCRMARWIITNAEFGFQALGSCPPNTLRITSCGEKRATSQQPSPLRLRGHLGDSIDSIRECHSSEALHLPVRVHRLEACWHLPPLFQSGFHREWDIQLCGVSMSNSRNAIVGRKHAGNGAAPQDRSRTESWARVLCASRTCSAQLPLAPPSPLPPRECQPPARHAPSTPVTTPRPHSKTGVSQIV
eukprot:1395371-Rhodomonas_salina.3